MSTQPKPEWLTQVEEMLDEKLAAQDKRSDEKFKRIDEKFTYLTSEMAEIKDQLDRQNRRLSSLEEFPRFPAYVRPSSQFRVTDQHSVSLPKRSKIGYAG